MDEDSDRALLCAEGYLQLGLLEDALRELESLPAEAQRRSVTLQLRVAILVRAKRWSEALLASEELRITDPEEPQGYLHSAYCLHELGRTVDARDQLLAAPVFVTEHPLYSYNLACYEAQLGNPHESANLLRIALKKDAKLYEIAASDPDLDPVRAVVRELGKAIEGSGPAAHGLEESDGEL